MTCSNPKCHREITEAGVYCTWLSVSAIGGADRIVLTHRQTIAGDRDIDKAAFKGPLCSVECICVAIKFWLNSLELKDMLASGEEPAEIPAVPAPAS